MNNSKRHKPFWDLAELITKFSETFTTEYFHLDKGEPYMPLVFEPIPGQWRANGCLVAMFNSSLFADNKEVVRGGLMAAGVKRRVAVYFNVGYTLLELMEELDTICNRYGEEPSEDDNRTVFAAMIETLWSIAPPPPKPNKADKERMKLILQDWSQKGVMRKFTISESTLNKSLERVRDWQTYTEKQFEFDKPAKRNSGRVTSHNVADMADTRALTPDELAED